MKLRTFQAATMAEALAQVKRQFGRDAVILHTRTFRSGGLLGLGGQPAVEITAARNVPAAAADKGGARAPRTISDQAKAAINRRSSHGASAAAEHAAITAEMQSLRNTIVELVRETKRSHPPAMPEDLFQAYLGLIENDVSDDLAHQLVRRVEEEFSEPALRDSEAVRRRLAASLETMLPVAGPVKLSPGPSPSVIALVGPTGVGKTTTAAKLAANFRLRENRKVGLITIDTYRIAAVEQLRTYAQIIHVPLEVVTSPTELRPALGRMSDCDVVLIDTAGRSQNDSIHVNELKCFLDQVRPHETHLVLSCTSGQKVLDRVLERFSVLGIDRVIFTKLDEAIGFGVILTSLQKAGVKLSYLTTGQDVPDDIEVGQAGRLADLIVGDAAEQAAGVS